VERRVRNGWRKVALPQPWLLELRLPRAVPWLQLMLLLLRVQLQ